MQMLALRPLSALRRSLALSEIGYVAVVLAVLTGAVIDDGDISPGTSCCLRCYFQ